MPIYNLKIMMRVFFRAFRFLNVSGIIHLPLIPDHLPLACFTPLGRLACGPGVPS